MATNGAIGSPGHQSFPRLTTAIQRNAELTRDLQAILQETLNLTQSNASSLSTVQRTAVGPVATSQEPEFHTAIDMGKVRLSVTVDDGTTMRVPCDHRQTIAGLIDLINGRLSKKGASPVVELHSAGAALDPSDQVGDLLVDGDAIAATSEDETRVVSTSPQERKSRSRSQTVVYGEDEEVDMSQLMHDITAKIHKADKALKCKAEAEKQAKLEAESLLHIFQSIQKDKTQAGAYILHAIMKLVHCEGMNLYLATEEPSGSAKLCLYQSGMSEDVTDSMDVADNLNLAMYGSDLSIAEGEGYVGNAATSHSRTTVVERRTHTGEWAITIGSPEMKDAARARGTKAILDEDASLAFTGPDAPEGWQPRNMLVFGVKYVPPSKSMVTEKSDAELEEVFNQIDKDGGGSLDRDEIFHGMRSLGKRLTTRELDEAMKEMDEDGSGEVDLDEFTEWWKKSYEAVQLGKIVAVIQVFNKNDNSFDNRDVKSLSYVCEQIAHLLKSMADELAFSQAAKDNEFLQQYNKTAGGKTVGVKALGSAVVATERFMKREGIGSLISPGTANKPHLLDPSLGQRTLSLERLVGLSLPTINVLSKWNFRHLDYSVEQLVGCVMIIFEDMGFLSMFKIREEVLQNYVTNLFKLYNDVPYHNVYHAFAVFQGCYWIVKQKDSGMAKNLTRLNHFSLLVAALAHDTGHMGCDNAFHANKYDELSITYNDKSLLESLHARNCFEVAKNTPDCNIFAAFDRAAFKGIRLSIIDAILHTDVQVYHGKAQTELNDLPATDIDMELDAKGEPKDKNFWMQVVLHGVDIANVAFEWGQPHRWARMVVTEFKMQYALEKRAGLPPTEFLNVKDDVLNSNRVPALAKLQMGYANFFVKPYIAALAKHIPEFEELIENINFNLSQWKNLTADGDGELPAAEGAELTCMQTAKEVLES